MEELRRKAAQHNMMSLLQKGVARVVDKAVESTKFLLGVKRMKAACMAVGVEGGKQAVREQVVARKFNP